MKKIPLANFGYRIDPNRFGMFRAVCDTHRVGWDLQGQSCVLELTEESILELLDTHLHFALIALDENTAPSGDLLKKELSSLEVP